VSGMYARMHACMSAVVKKAVADLQDHGELGVSVWHVRSLRHEGGHDVAKLQKRLVDILRLHESETRGARLVHPLTALPTPHLAFVSTHQALKLIICTIHFCSVGSAHEASCINTPQKCFTVV
jgi:hypothetical protein